MTVVTALVEPRAVGAPYRSDGRGYWLASAIILATLVAIAAWVATGHGLPGGSLWRRATGQEGPTGGLTTAMRAMLHGRFAEGMARHPAALPMSLYLLGQITWRGGLLTWRPAARAWWPYDLAGSLALFAAAIYLPYWLA